MMMSFADNIDKALWSRFDVVEASVRKAKSLS